MTKIQLWEHRCLTDLAEYINGYAFKPEDWGEEGLPIIRIEQLKNPDSISDFYSGKLDEKNIIKNGDLIFSWSASLFLRIWQHGNAALNQHLFKVIEKEWVDRIFLKQFIEYYLPEITKASHGSTMQHITRKELDRFTAPFPTDKLEQSKIAEVLSTVDLAIEQTKSLIAKQQRTKTGLMQDLLTRGIDKHGKLRSEETHEFKDSPLGRIPMEWDFVPIASVLCKSPKNGYSPVESNIWNGTYMLGLGCLTMSGFQPVQLKYAPQFSSVFTKAILKQGDFLISRSNTRDLVGMVGIYKDIGVPCIYPDLMIRLRFSNDVVTEFMEQVFMSTLMRRQITNAATGTSGSMVKISSALVKNFYFFKPAFEEQQRIIKVLKEQDSSRITIEKTKNKLYLIKAALMQDLLTGKVRVTPLMENTGGC